MENQYLPLMIDLARRAGEVALRIIEDSSPTLKPDKSVLTKADTAISSLVRQELSDILSTGEHLLIDEEDGNSPEYFDQDTLEKYPYLWVCDPIDGTRSFSNQIPFYGISLGVLRDLKPWLGVVYLPTLKELFVCDGEAAFFTKEAFTEQEKKNPINPIDQVITKQSIYMTSDMFFTEFKWDYSLCQVMMPSCAVIDLCWPALGRGCGCFFKAHIWDFAGSWPIVRAAGLDLRAMSSGKVLDRIDTGLFVGKGSQTWKLKEHHILSSERNFPIIKNNINII